MDVPVKMSIRQLSEEDRPREKMLMKGIQTLSNAELIAILIGSGNREETAVELSQRILSTYGNSVSKLGKSSVKELMNNFNGIGEAKAISIIAALELGRRRKLEEPPKKERIMCSSDAYEIMSPMMIDLPYEEFWVLYMNVSNGVIEKVKASQGGVSATVVDMKLILKTAINTLASSIMLFHNHPSENIYPSSADDKLTQDIKTAASLLDIRVLDHIIIGEHGYFSYADDGRL